MDLATLSMLNHEFLKKDPDIVLEEDPLIIVYSKYYIVMANDGKGTKHTHHLVRRLNFVRNGENCKMHRMYWCEGGL